MQASQQGAQTAAPTAFLTAFEEVSEAVESGAGLPAVARAAAHALDASVAVLDAAGAVLAVACLSPEDERAVLAGEGATETLDLRVADARVGLLRLRPRGTPAEAALLRIVDHADLPRRWIAPPPPSAPARRPSPTSCRTWSSRKVTDRENILARAAELGCDLAAGASVVVARARPQRTGGGRLARACPVGGVARGARGGAHLAGGLGGARCPQRPGARELVIVVPGAGATPASAPWRPC